MVSSCTSGIWTSSCGCKTRGILAFIILGARRCCATFLGLRLSLLMGRFSAPGQFQRLSSALQHRQVLAVSRHHFLVQIDHGTILVFSFFLGDHQGQWHIDLVSSDNGSEYHL